MTIVTMRHIRAAKVCAGGARHWFKDHEIDWNDFLKNGVDSEVLLATGDQIAARVVAQAEAEAENG